MTIVRGFRRCFHSSTILSSSRQAATEISNLVAGSNVEKSERSSAAASYTSKRPIQKRVTSADRKAMLESFVDKYRAMNLGKFPTPTSAQKEVGGNYYFVRKLLQEIEYNLKISSVEKEPVKENEKKTKDEDTITNREIEVKSSESQEVLDSQIAMDQQFHQEMISSVEKEPVKDKEIKTEDQDNIIKTEIEVESFEYQEISESQSTMDQEFYQELGYIFSVEKEPVEEHEMKTKDEDTIIKKEVEVKSSDIQDGSDGQSTMDKQIFEDRGTESVSNLDSNFELREGLQLSTSNADTGNTNLITREDTHNIATECRDGKGQCDEKLEQDLKDESPLEDKFAFEDTESNVQLSTSSADTGNINHITREDAYNIVTESHDGKGQCDEKLEQNLKNESLLEDKITFEDTESSMEKEHDGIQNVRRDMPQQQTDDESKEKPSIWENMKSLATGFINIWRK